MRICGPARAALDVDIRADLGFDPACIDALGDSNCTRDAGGAEARGWTGLDLFVIGRPATALGCKQHWCDGGKQPLCCGQRRAFAPGFGDILGTMVSGDVVTAPAIGIGQCLGCANYRGAGIGADEPDPFREPCCQRYSIAPNFGIWGLADDQ